MADCLCVQPACLGGDFYDDGCRKHFCANRNCRKHCRNSLGSKRRSGVWYSDHPEESRYGRLYFDNNGSPGGLHSFSFAAWALFSIGECGRVSGPRQECDSRAWYQQHCKLATSRRTERERIKRAANTIKTGRASGVGFNRPPVRKAF